MGNLILISTFIIINSMLYSSQMVYNFVTLFITIPKHKIFNFDAIFEFLELYTEDIDNNL